MQTVKILHRHTQEVLFECEAPWELDEGEAMGFALLKAVESHVVLNYAKLRGCKLHRGILSNAQLNRADFTGSLMRRVEFPYAGLRECTFEGATLIDCEFRFALAESVDFTKSNLIGSSFELADLEGANFIGAILEGVTGDGFQLFSLQTDPYPITVWEETLQIGCKRYTIEEWKAFSDRQISAMDMGALAWWRKWKEPLLQIIEVNRS